MPNNNTYKCPGCHKVQGKWTQTLTHAKTCCPDLVLKKGIRQRDCLATSEPSKRSNTVKKGKTRALKPKKLRNLVIERNEVAGDARAIPKHAVAVKKIKLTGKKCHEFIPETGKKRKRKNCQTFVDPQRLFFLQCKICRDSYDFSDQIAEYLWCRRRTRKEQGLLSITAPLDGPSCSLLSKVTMSCGIASNTAMPHITLVEGLLPDKKHFAVYLQQLKSLRMALLVDSSIKILEIHSVPRKSDDSTLLIVADVGVRQSVVTASRAMASNQEACVLPQFPFHIALGACSKENKEQVIHQVSQRLLNATLSGIDSTLLAVLPPPVHDKLFLANNNKGSDDEGAEQSMSLESHKEREEETLKRFPNIAVAMEVADSLNESLAASPTFTWRRTTEANKKEEDA